MTSNLITQDWQTALRSVAKEEKIAILSSFFKTAPGEYGEGDIFIGVTVPDNRSVARAYSGSSIEVIAEMLDSPVHEFRLSALLALVYRYKKSKNIEEKNSIIDFYITNSHKCNNWDLVDLSAGYLLGEEIHAGRRIEQLKTLSTSPTLWHRRIAVVATLTSVRRGVLDLAIEQCTLHISDPEPLMQKAVGWVLREVGKKSEAALNAFLTKNISRISSITLSYATEKLDKPSRKAWQALRKQSSAKSFTPK